MMHIITLRLLPEVSAVLPMIDDFASANQGMTAQQMLFILWKHFGLGDQIQAHAARESLCTYTTEMQNVMKYAQKWHSTILVLQAENYPIIYMEMVLNFV